MNFMVPCFILKQGTMANSKELIAYFTVHVAIHIFFFKFFKCFQLFIRTIAFITIFGLLIIKSIFLSRTCFRITATNITNMTYRCIAVVTAIAVKPHESH